MNVESPSTYVLLDLLQNCLVPAFQVENSAIDETQNNYWIRLRSLFR